MPIEQRHNKFQVTVTRKDAKPGYQRIRKSTGSYTEAQDLEQEITAAIDQHGMWPVRNGSFKEAGDLALKHHWAGMRYAESVKFCLPPLVAFMEARGKHHLDDIEPDDIDALVTHYRSRGVTPSYINQLLGIIRTVNKFAIKRGLASKKVHTDHVHREIKETWWMTPEDHLKATEWLRRPGGDHLFADYIDTVVYQGLRVEETLRLLTRSFTGLDGRTPSLIPPGTKTVDAKNTIPLYPEALPVVLRAIQRAEANGWQKIYPMTYQQAGQRWNDVREFLGVSHVGTATLRALRRTFAYYANSRGMPTSTLQKVLRHKDIKTTSGYLNLIGSSEVAESRRYFDREEPQALPVTGTRGDIATAIQAYVSTGAGPEEVARFVKEMMT